MFGCKNEIKFNLPPPHTHTHSLNHAFAHCIALKTTKRNYGIFWQIATPIEFREDGCPSLDLCLPPFVESKTAFPDLIFPSGVRERPGHGSQRAGLLPHHQRKWGRKVLHRADFRRDFAAERFGPGKGLYFRRPDTLPDPPVVPKESGKSQAARWIY